MAKRRRRDIERTYTRQQFVAKLRRLADALETEAPFTIQVAGERLRLPADVAFNIEHERSAVWTRSSFSCAGVRTGRAPAWGRAATDRDQFVRRVVEPVPRCPWTRPA